MTDIAEPTSTETALVPNDLYEIDMAEFRRRVNTPNRNISTAGKRFKFPDGQSSPGPMTCIVLDYVEYNTLYEGAYDRDNPKPPICWAYDKFPDSMGPREDEVANPISNLCARCPKNKWTPKAPGSKQNHKECKNQYRLAIVQPTATKDSDIFILTVSPTGRKHWDKYLSTLKGLGFRERRVVTEIDWDPNVQQTMVFRFKAPHEVEAPVIAHLLHRVTNEDMLYASPGNRNND